MDLESTSEFTYRHIGPDADQQAEMLAYLGYTSLDEMAEAAVPDSILDLRSGSVAHARSEEEVQSQLFALASQNRMMRQMIGQGYYDTVMPAVIRRNVLENPAWYTAYTPYQAEISQGRLEALLVFQTVVSDLTGLAFANASLLDEASAAAEAMMLCMRQPQPGAAGEHPTFAIDADCLPQTIALLRTRAEPLGINVVMADLAGKASLPEGDLAGVLLQYPGASGAVVDLGAAIAAAHDRGALVVMAADPLALCLLRSPAELGADIAIGSTQRFGVPLGFGGPHAAYIAVRHGLERSLPGRLVGVSRDAEGNPALRLAVQTREQHIRRDRATSNICTAQVLPAVLAAMYAVYHGPEGLRRIAERVHRHAAVLARQLAQTGVEVVHPVFFDTLVVRVPAAAARAVAAAADAGVNLRLVDDDHVGISCDERTDRACLDVCLSACLSALGTPPAGPPDEAPGEGGSDVPITAAWRRRTEFLTHPVFHLHRSETSMLRYLRQLADRDYALDRGMIPLGSCTMKLNATFEMEPITWDALAGVHPLAPPDQTRGYAGMIAQLEEWLAAITGYHAVFLAPNAGSQGELAGLLAIRAYQRADDQGQRNVCLIPTSAHGTNAASAVLAGMRVVAVACDEAGNVDRVDLKAKIAEHNDRLSALMVTYPSTHGVYEEGMDQICRQVHDVGGQVYLDGANLNALIGMVSLSAIGCDVSHLNLHKTFCIPHGGGGPGVGPVAVRAHLAPYVPSVTAAPWGSAGVLPITWAYIAMMGSDGLALATKVAVLSANYLARRLSTHFPILYTGREGLVAHECILDLRPLSRASGVTVTDVAKRLIDYGFHAPTVSFPVTGTLMIEPTESEDLAELDRFCEAMEAIRSEIDKVAAGEWSRDDNPLKNAPHTAAGLAGCWTHPYSRAEAAFPVESLSRTKYWAPVGRIDEAWGDRHLLSSLPKE